VMKDARLGGGDILNILNGEIADMPRTVKPSISEMYEGIEGNKLTYIRNLVKEDPLLAKKMAGHHKRMERISKSNISEKIKLFKGLSVDERVQRLMNMGAHKNRALLNEMIRNGVATKGVIQAMRLKERSY
jgi:transcriptional regulator of met regulon